VTRKLHDDAAMTFTEIGKRIGVTGPGAAFIYRKAMRKIRADREALARFHDLVEFRRREKLKKAA
jgi:hypothetical protein